MSQDPWAELRLNRDITLAGVQGTSIADEYERGAIAMAWAGLTGEDEAPGYEATLRVELRGMDHIDAYAAGQVAQAVQQATALLARHQLDPARKIDRVSKGDRQRALLIQEAQNGNVVWFKIPSSLSVDGLVPEGERAAQRAVRELVEFLPQTASDDAAVDGILGAAQPIRKAIDYIAEAATTSAEGLGLRFSVPGATATTSLLTHDRAQALHETLSEKQQITLTEHVIGVVDGMRNSRRVLYIVQDDRSELAVSVQDFQLPSIRRLISQRVVAQLESTQSQQPNGNVGRKSYRLLQLAPEGTLFDSP